MNAAGGVPGRVALVTGAAQGVGAEIARVLAAAGARVAVNDRAASAALDSVAAEVGGVAVPGDVSDRAAMHDVVARAEAGLGPVDILVCNAAVEEMGDVLSQSDTSFFRQIDVNLTGTYWGVEAVLPGMRERAFGRIVIISSIWAITGWPRAVGYSTSKGGVIPLAKSLARREAAHGIAVNVIAPGVIDSPQLAEDARDAGIPLEEMRALYSARTAVQRVATPREIAGTVAFLSGAAAPSFVGQVLQPNGGAQFGWA